MTTSPSATFCPAFRAVRDPAWLYPANGHRQALMALEAGVDAGHAVTLLTGEAGAGKTLLLYAVVARYHDELRVGWFSQDGSSPNDPLRSALEAFRVDAPDLEPAELLSRLRKFLERGPGAGRPALLIVDDAHLLSDWALDQLRQASELEVEGAPLLCLILAGEPGLRARLAQPQNLGLKNRIGGRFHLPPLNDREAAGYVAHRLAIARCACHGGVSPFEPGALKILHHWSGGVPGVLNELARRCLHDADLARLEKIGASFVEIRLRAALNDRGAARVAGAGAAGRPDPAADKGGPVPAEPDAPPPAKEQPARVVLPAPAAEQPASAPRGDDSGATPASQPASQPQPAATAPSAPAAGRPLPEPYAEGAPVAAAASRRGSVAILLAGAAAVAAGLVWVLLPAQDETGATEIAAVAPTQARGAAGTPSTASKDDPITALAAAPEGDAADGEGASSAAQDAPEALTFAGVAALPAGTSSLAGHLPPVAGVSPPPDPAALMSEALEAGDELPGLATVLYERAALRGNKLAAYFAGQAYETGEGVGVDHNRARAWYRAAGGLWGADERLEALADRPVVQGLNSRPVPVMQTVLPSGQLEIHWRAADRESPTRFAVEYVLAGGNGQPLRVQTDRSAILLDGPVARWRLITLDVVGYDAEATEWMSPAPVAR